MFGDSELVVRQVGSQCQTKHPRLRAYRNEVWDLVENLFYDFNINFMLRDKNKMEDSVVLAASKFRPPQNPLLRYEFEMRYHPSIPYNINHWQVFEDEEQVQHFMETVGEFSNMVFDSIPEDDSEEPKTRWEETLARHRVLQLKGNVIPKGLVPLERLFDKNDIPVNPRKMTLDEPVRDVNIRTEEYPKVINLSKGVLEEYQGQYLSLFQ